ncbi:N-formylglutamate amidohydrolase [Rhodobacteraceae bacterium XHP0102]|nr:N-formylglutamate amidohydrolase [Rhodobacteraceae bacterium XHP0102]
MKNVQKPDPSYYLTLPEVSRAPVVVASPHSGHDYPQAFLDQIALDAHQIRSSEDAFVQLLVDRAADFGVPFLRARFPRAYVDLNRGTDELDAAVISGVARAVTSPRIAAGLGVIPRVVANGRSIYRGKILRADAEERLAQIWRPYHDCLARLMEAAKLQFGRAVLLDFHSMPHDALGSSLVGPEGKRPDLILGDRFGGAAAHDVIDLIHAAFEGQGFTVARNTPFAGAYIAQTYGRPARGFHAVQVEIDRALYMDEVGITPHAGFEATRDRVSAALAQIISELGRDCALPLAAE